MSKFDLWEHFRTDITGENKMYKLMQIGCVKAFGDLFQEILGNAAQVPVYRGNKPMQIKNPDPMYKNIMFTDFYESGRDRPLIQAGTDRPSAIGRACLFSSLGKPNDVNNMVLTGYSTSENNYFYIRPRKTVNNMDLISQKSPKIVKPSKNKPIKSVSNIKNTKNTKNTKKSIKKDKKGENHNTTKKRVKNTKQKKYTIKSKEESR